MNEELRYKIQTCDTQKELDNLVIELFNTTYKKQAILRAMKLSDLQDKVIEQAEKRITLKADEFSNDDLLKYMNSINAALDKIQSVQDPKVPMIAVQNNYQLGLSDESKDRIREYLKGIIGKNDFIIPENN